MSQLLVVLELLDKRNHVDAKAIVRLSEAANTQRKIHLIIQESCHVIVIHGNCENNTGKRRMRSVWNMATTASGSVTHYAKFPNELAERCILCGTAEGDIVLDPFVGSGTTCRVANRYGRQYIGIDLNPAYCKAAEAEIPINLF